MHRRLVHTRGVSTLKRHRTYPSAIIVSGECRNNSAHEGPGGASGACSGAWSWLSRQEVGRCRAYSRFSDGSMGEEFSMQAFINRVGGFLKSEDGATATEYAVMLALIIVVALTAIQTLGTSVTGV